jgi:general secretion pathway protein A
MVRPFEPTPDPEFLYLSSELKEVLATLEYGIIQKRGFILLVGKPGTGKTTLLNSLMEKAKRNTTFAYISNPAADFDDLLHTLQVKFNLAPVDEDLSKAKAIHRLNAFVMEGFKEGRNTAIIVDEAQCLDVKAFEGLRLLSNLETRKEKLIQIIISGQPELATTLGEKKLIQLVQRIGLRCQTKPLSEKETHEYIEHRLKIAGYKGPQVFANKATKMIWAYSDGIPRTINIICDNALLTGYSKDTKRIDSSIVQEVINDLSNLRLNNLEPQKEQTRGPIEVQGKRKEKRFSLAWTAAIVAVVIINIVISYVFMGNVRHLLDELSLKLENAKDRAQYQSEGRDLPSDKAKTDTLQRSDTRDENKMNFREDTSSSKSGLQPALDKSQSESEVDGSKTGDEDSVVVRKGETLEEIMMRVYRKRDTKILDAILKINPEIKNPNRIYENQIVRLPSKADQD